MNKELDIILKKAIDLLNNKKQIKEVVKEYNYAKLSIAIGNYDLEIIINKYGDSNEN